MTKLYSNENFPLPAVEELRALGHDVITSFEAGQANRLVPDKEVLNYAKEQGRAVITLNRRDFIKLHRLAPRHAGIIVCSVDPDNSAMAGRIDESIREQNPLDNKLIRINKE